MSFVSTSKDFVDDGVEYRQRSGHQIRRIGDEETTVDHSLAFSFTRDDNIVTHLQARSLRTGHVVWRRAFPSQETLESRWDVTVGDGEVVVSTDTHTRAYSEQSGHRDWTRHIGGLDPSYGHGRFYVPPGLEDHHPHILAAKTGKTLVADAWNGPIYGPMMVTRHVVVFANSYNGQLVAISATCKQSPCRALWTHDLSEQFLLAVGDHRVVEDDSGAGGNDPHFINIYDLRSGRRLAHVRATGYSASTVVSNNLILRYDIDGGTVQALPIVHPGRIVWQHKVTAPESDPGVAGQIAVLGRTLVVASNTSDLTHFHLKQSK